MVDYLVGNVELKQAARLIATVESESLNLAKSRDPRATTGQLFILAGGQMAPNPAELLSGDCFKRLVSAALSEFDRVVVDSAPILAVSDTLLMIPHVQTTCMVVRAGKTPRNAINRAFTHERCRHSPRWPGPESPAAPPWRRLLLLLYLRRIRNRAAPTPANMAATRGELCLRQWAEPARSSAAVHAAVISYLLIVISQL